MSDEPSREPFSSRQLTPFAIVMIYVAIGAAWIALSDQLLVSLVSDPGLLHLLQNLKGWL